MKLSVILMLLLSVSSILAVDASKYDQALELYKQGPSKGTEIVELLREQLKTKPEDVDALCLLGITLFGIEKPDEALPVINRAIEVAGKTGEIRPKMLMLKARTLYELHRYFECKRILEVYWAFWQDDDVLKKHYEWYYPRVVDAKEPGKANQSEQTVRP